ncbi:MAG: FRG domain-containing protein [Bacilli bacterium]|nr:FRG domain-containing protein [Bacilli bacterium]
MDKGKTIYIKNMDQLKQVFGDLVEKNCIYRGINNCSQKLPKIIRDDDFSSVELDILKSFESYYGLYSSANNCWEFISLAQHCGLMTRLIDFTYNPYVALFFALHSEKKQGEKYIVYSIKKELTEIVYGYQQNLFEYEESTGVLKIYDDFSNRHDANVTFTEDLRASFEYLKESKMIQIAEPNYRNQRILMQQGLFVVPSDLKKETIEDIFEMADIYVINEKIRDNALAFLEKMGFNEFKLMPDLDSACNEINHKFQILEKKA